MPLFYFVASIYSAKTVYLSGNTSGSSKLLCVLFVLLFYIVFESKFPPHTTKITIAIIVTSPFNSSDMIHSSFLGR